MLGALALLGLGAWAGGDDAGRGREVAGSGYVG